MDNLRSKFIILACFVISAASVFYILKANQNVGSSQRPSYAPPVAIAESPVSTTIDSPDGKKKLTVKEEKGKETKTYTFSVLDLATGFYKDIFNKTVPTATTLSIPLNTFSPDDKYIFLKETSGDTFTYFVPLEGQTLDILSMFAEKHPDYKITDVTGWGGMTLIVVNTDKKDGGQGPSFWFDVTSKSFIQLNNRFN